MQNEVESFLESALAADAPVTRIETHAAMVFLSGKRALKIKRAVRLPFLDFSTLEQRKAACEAEFATNKPIAPTIYRRVIPITRECDGRLKIDGDGEPVEWALDMLRFDERATLDLLAGRRAITTTLASAIADAIAASHRKATIASTSGWVQSIPAIIQQNAGAFRASGFFPANDRDALEDLSKRAWAKHLPLIARRSKGGFVRRCHGDLHLANIALIEGKPVLFDAIEFDEKLATIDVMHDLAFTLMDLVHAGCIDAANVVLNRYLDSTPLDNVEAVGLLPLFMSMRAAVRANVLLCRSAQPDQVLLDLAATYFKLARSVLQPVPACVVAIGGLSGTGKTAVARSLAPLVGALPGAVVLRSDVLRKRMLGAGELERLAPSAYESAVSTEVYARLAADAAKIAGRGHSVVVDAVFARETERSAIASAAAQAAVPFTGIFLTADLAIRLERIMKRRGDASDATTAIAKAQEEYDLGTIDWAKIDAGDTQDATANLCAALLRRSLLCRAAADV